MTKWVLWRGVGRDALQLVGIDDAAAAALHLLEVAERLRTFRMKSRHSSGFTSVPVAIMSTVTAMRGLYVLRKLAEQFVGVFAGALGR